MNTASAHRASLDAPASEQARSQKGNALVDFALVLPMFLLLVFGMITFSIALHDKALLSTATRNGARAGALYANPAISDDTRKSNAQKKAQEDTCLASLINFGSGVVNVPLPDITTDASGNKIITVTATYPYTGLYLFSSSPITLEAKNSMRIEN